MTNRFLHITNGSCLTNYLKDLNIRGEFFTWHEMLCEGPTCEIVDSQQFLNIRKAFLSDFYQIEIDEYAFQDLQIFPNPTSDFITISIKESGSYTIVNSLGQKVLNGVLSSTTNQIQLIDLYKGLYFINVSSSLGTMTRKLIVE